ncbi:MAG: YlxR family protein [Armatimonadota bacterium]
MSRPPKIRTCVACKRKAHQNQLIRLAVQQSPAGFFSVTLWHGVGRSAYFCPCQSCLDLVQKGQALSRSFRKKIQPDSLTSLQTLLNAN